MIPYYVMLLIIVFCIFREERLTTEKSKRWNFIFALMPFFVLMAFKADTIGTDTERYLASYRELAQYHVIDVLDPFGYERIELGYKTYILLLSRFLPDPQFLLIVTSVFVSISLYYFISRTSTNRCLALFFFVTLGFFQFAMSGIRQTIAICIMLWSYEFIVKRKLWKFALMVLLAMQFHKSSVLAAPIYFIADMRFSKKAVGILFVGFIILFNVSDILLLQTADVMNYDYGIEETGNGYIFFFIVLFITILVVNDMERLKSLRSSNLHMINVNFVSLALWVVRLVSRTAERVSLYFMPYTYIVLEEYLMTRPKEKKYSYIFIAIILSSFLCLKRLDNAEQFSNFKFFFEV